VSADEFEDFLTVPAYEMVNAKPQNRLAA
jgi:hypothetical protein